VFAQGISDTENVKHQKFKKMKLSGGRERLSDLDLPGC
jgi:hypothetical protein